MNLAPVFSFLQAHTVLLSVGALIISVISLSYTVLKDKAQNKRWDHINLARIIIRNLQFATWRLVPWKEFDSTDWGYADVFGLPKTDTNGVLDRTVLRVPAGIVAIDNTGKTLEGIDAITVHEMYQQLWDRNFDPFDVTLQRAYRITYDVENNGMTAASVKSISAWVHEVKSPTPGNNEFSPQILQPNDVIHCFTDLRCLLSDPFLDGLHFQIRIIYLDVHRRERTLDQTYIFERRLGSFRRA